MVELFEDQGRKVQYWAIGEDCCGPSGRAGFACGDYKGEQGKQRNTIVEVQRSDAAQGRGEDRCRNHHGAKWTGL